jgi:hypothetical protein
MRNSGAFNDFLSKKENLGNLRTGETYFLPVAL